MSHALQHNAVVEQSGQLAPVVRWGMRILGAVVFVLLAGCQTSRAAPPPPAPHYPSPYQQPHQHPLSPQPPTPPAPPPPVPNAQRRCCVPSGAAPMPGTNPYGDCIKAGGRPWGTDGCGVGKDGKPVDPPPSAAPGI